MMVNFGKLPGFCGYGITEYSNGLSHKESIDRLNCYTSCVKNIWSSQTMVFAINWTHTKKGYLKKKTPYQKNQKYDRKSDCSTATIEIG